MTDGRQDDRADGSLDRTPAGDRVPAGAQGAGAPADDGVSPGATDDGAAYRELKRLFALMTNLQNASALLQHDAAIFMAPGSEADRTQQVLAIASARYDILSAPRMAALLDEAEGAGGALSREDRRNLSLMRREWVNAAGLGPALAQDMARVSSEGDQQHRRHMKSGDWSAIRDWYVHVFAVMRAAGAALQARLGTDSPYDALLDQFSPGLRERTLAGPFAAVEKALPALIRAAVARQAAEPPPLKLPSVPLEKQAELCRRIARAMNFDFTRGRQEIAAVHPYSTGSPDDTRYTVECREDDFLYGVYTVLHENGHANYTQGLPRAWRYQPAGTDMNMAIHESMSRIMEQYAGRSPEFLQYLEREARDVFGMPDDPALDAANLARILMRVTPSLIRIEADELTYPAHILLRTRLEKAAVEGAIDVADMPRHWDDGIEELLGVRPADPSEGCMQDCHWPSGLVGYFPTYTLGDMGAAQLFAAACRDRPELRTALAQGNFTPLTGWLTEHVYAQGSLVTPDELFVAATGTALDPRHYLDHLSRRYLGRPWQEPPAPGPRDTMAPAP